MPLIPITLQIALESKLESKGKEALKKAMEKFKEKSEAEASKPAGEQSDVFSAALAEASTAFGQELKKLGADIATEVDKYIKTATIIVPPGQAVATAGSPAAQVGVTTAPSPPALIT